MRHPWLVGRVLSPIEVDGAGDEKSFRVQEMGRPVPQAKDTFKSQNKYFLRYQETKKAKKRGDTDVTTDVYKTPKAQISQAAVRVVSTVSFDSLAWWGKKEKVLKKTGQLFHEVLKELSSNTRINWELPKRARTKATGYNNTIYCRTPKHEHHTCNTNRQTAKENDKDNWLRQLCIGL
jgi:hypothetical protein